MNKKEKNKPLKDLEVRLIAELMKNSRRSDRELAKAIGTSQPTISRLIKKLERQGAIKEYTIIPDFTQLGYTLMGATLLEVKGTLSREKFKEVRKVTTDIEKNAPNAALLAVNGIGGKKNRLFLSFYEKYADYSRAMTLARRIPSVDVDTMESLLVDLSDETNYRVLSMSAIANHLLQRLKRANES
jgi:DNA-binding Lrp family transcriptional regulator